MGPNRGSKQSNEHGRWGEEMATAYLVTQGYAIVDRNWRMGHYEIDIIAQKDQYIVFVEVKMRASEATSPIDAVDKRKRARMVASANAYMTHYDIPFEYRFDIIAVTGNEKKHAIEHIPDAFFPPLKRHNFTFRL